MRRRLGRKHPLVSSPELQTVRRSCVFWTAAPNSREGFAIRSTVGFSDQSGWNHSQHLRRSRHAVSLGRRT